MATVAFNELILLNQFISTTFTDQVIPEYVIFFFYLHFLAKPMYRHYHTEVYIGAEILFGTSFLLPS